MILKILDRKKSKSGAKENGFVYIDDIDNIKIFWSNSNKFGIMGDMAKDKSNPNSVVIDGEVYKFFVTEDEENGVKIDQIKPHLIFVDLNRIENELVENKIVYLSGGKIYKRNGVVEYFIMDNHPCAFLMNDSGKTIEKLQKDV